MIEANQQQIDSGKPYRKTQLLQHSGPQTQKWLFQCNRGAPNLRSDTEHTHLDILKLFVFVFEDRDLTRCQVGEDWYAIQNFFLSQQYHYEPFSILKISIPKFWYGEFHTTRLTIFQVYCTKIWYIVILCFPLVYHALQTCVATQ